MTSQEAVVKRIIDLCQKQKIAHYTLACRAAIPQSTLKNIFYGTNPTISTISKICSGFGITLYDFFQVEYFLICEEDD